MTDSIHASGVSLAGTLTPDNLFAGDFPVVSGKGILKSGENRQRGTVLGRITATGKLVMSLAASEDDSENIFAILAHDCDASGGDKECVFYKSGHFNASKLTFGTGHTAASLRDAARALSIHF